MIGIDIPIQKLTTLFTKRLWTGYNCDFTGRIYDNEKYENKNLLGINPDKFISGKNYHEKLLDSKQDATVFFRVTNTDLETQIADVQIYFSVNLATLYPSVSYRADEHAIQDAKNIIDYSAFKISDVVRGREAFADYFGAEQTKHDMQPFCLFRFDTTCFFQTSTCTNVDDINYTLTLSAGTGGTTVPAPGSTSYAKGAVTAAYASVSAGYRFVQWLQDGVQKLLNPLAVTMSSDVNLVASFIKQWTLTLSASGDGTVTPETGLYDEGEITLTATPTDPEITEFTQWLIDGSPITDNPYILTLGSNVTAVGYFQDIYQIIMDVFTTSPVLSGSEYINEDQSGNNNDVKNINVQAAKFNRTTWVDIQGTSAIHLTTIEIEGFVRVDLNDGAFRGIVGKSNSTGNNREFLFSTSSNNFYILTSVNGASFDRTKILGTYTTGAWHHIYLKLDSTDLIFIKDGIELINEPSGGLALYNGNEDYSIAAYNNGSAATIFEGGISFLKLTGIFKFNFQEGWLDKLYNVLGNGYNGTIINPNLYNFWHLKGNIFNPSLSNGYELYQSAGLPDIKVEFANGVPITPTIAGYTKVAEIAANKVSANGYDYLWPENLALSENTYLNAVGIYSYKFNVDKIKSKWDNAIEFTVNENGTGDYPTIRAAILDQDGETFVKINVQAGTYYELDIQGIDNVWLCGVGEVLIISDGLSTDISPSDYSFIAYANTAYNLIPQIYKHAFYVVQSMLITNINSTANDVKYNVHQDLNGAYDSCFSNCNFVKIENNNPSYFNNIGLGVWANQIVRYDNCNFEFQTTQTVPANKTTVGFHNIASQSNTAKLFLQDCISISGHLLGLLDLTSGQNDVVTVVDCIINESGKGIYYLSNTPDILVIAINTILTIDITLGTNMKELIISATKRLYGDTDNFIEGSPYTGASPQPIDYNVISLLTDNLLINITQDENSISQLIIRE